MHTCGLVVGLSLFSVVLRKRHFRMKVIKGFIGPGDWAGLPILLRSLNSLVDLCMAGKSSY